MPKGNETILTGGRVPIEMHESIASRAKARKISKSVYTEATFRFWSKIGRPDIEQMDILALHFEQTGKLELPESSPSDLTDPRFLTLVTNALDRIKVLEEQAKAKESP